MESMACVHVYVNVDYIFCFKYSTYSICYSGALVTLIIYAKIYSLLKN